ncbi:hypothetical protein D3C79_794030 [compost metagenome]
MAGAFRFLRSVRRTHLRALQSRFPRLAIWQEAADQQQLHRLFLRPDLLVRAGVVEEEPGHAGHHDRHRRSPELLRDRDG